MAMKYLFCFVILYVQIISSRYVFNQVLRIHNHDEHKPVTLFSHGVGADHTQADFYRTLFCTNNYVTFNYPDAPEKLFTCNRRTGPAQKSEMKSFAHVMDVALNAEQPVVLYGLSRGASVIINEIGARVALNKIIPNIQAIILESPFAHCEDVIQGYSQQFKLPLFFMRFLVKRFFKEYHKTKNAPIDLVHYIPHDIPVLFIGTTQDTVVPMTSTRRLYEKLRASGHKKVHILELPDGIHANIVWGRYGREYHIVLQAFYSKYDLPHDSALAELGAERFAECRPIFQLS